MSHDLPSLWREFLSEVDGRLTEAVVLHCHGGFVAAVHYGVYLQHVPLTSAPESYEERLTRLFPGEFKNLRLLALDPYDLALSKLSRNTAVDREDVQYLARTIPLDPQVLLQRYQDELRPIMLGDSKVHDQTLEMWIEAYFPS
jgi:hypothetical protein